MRASAFLRRLVVLAVGSSALLGAHERASAESIGEAVEKHVDENLEGKEKTKKKKQKSDAKKADSKQDSSGQKSDAKKDSSAQKADAKKSDAKKSTSSPDSTAKKTATSPKSDSKTTSSKESAPSSSRASTATAEPRDSGFQVNGNKVNFLAPGEEPPRVIGENFEIDPQAGFGLRGWYPEQYPSLAIQTQHYPQWYVGFNGRFFRFLRIYKAFYQSVGLASPRNDGAVIAKAATKAAPGLATQAFGMMGLQIKFILVPMFRYEARSYAATAAPLSPVRIIPFSASETDDVTDYELTEEELYAVSTFETAIFGLHYNDRMKGPDGEILPPKFLPFYFGLGLTQYRKPYQVTVGNDSLDELMFNSRFRGAGLALGFDIAGGINKLGINFASQVGLGQIHLMEDFTLNEALPDDWLIGYLQGELEVDYTVKLLNTKPTLLLSPVLEVGATSFFYVKKSGDSDVGAPLANWDLLYAGMGRLILPL